MNVTRKLLCLLLALAMILPMLPAVAQAEEVPGEAQTDRIVVPVPEEETDDVIPESGITRAEIPFQVNPLYEGLYEPDLENLPQAPEPDEIVTHAATFQSEENAAKTIRNNMKNRAETYTVYVYSTNSDYNALFLELLNNAVVHTGVGTEGDYLMWHLAGWGGEVSIAESGAGYNYTFTYVTPYYTTAAQEKEMTTAVNNLINSLGVRNKSDYEKVCAVYDWICANVSYDYANLEDTSYALKFSAYAALVNKTAVCQGYALLFYRLMLELGVDTRFIGGDGGGPHAWNIVKLGDYYYTVDATWDAGYTDYDYFLKSTWTFYGHSRDPEFDYWEFHMAHPMAAEDYIHGGTATLDPYISMGYCGTAENDYLNAAWAMMRNGTLLIAGEGATMNYSAKALPYWYYWMDHIEYAVVSEGITKVGDYAFYKLPSLTAVATASSVEEIGAFTFAQCEALRQLVLSEGLVTIGKSAFYNCKVLNEVTFPNTLKEIGTDAFRECDSLESAILPDGITSLGESVFRDCNALKEASLPDSLAAISKYTFDNCTSLETVRMPEMLTKINDAAFRDCTALKTVVIPEGVTSIGSQAFFSCGLDSVTLPDGLETLGSSAFAGCKGLKHITLPGSLTVTGEHVFVNCDGLETVVLSEGITEISLGAFTDCTNLKTVTFPSTLLWIREEAFGYCSSLESLELPAGLQGIMGIGFYKCTSLTEIDFPESCATLGKAAFKDCTSLRRVSLSRNMSVINESLFENCPIEELKLPPNLSTINEYAFAGAQITELKINDVKRISQNAFRNCDKLVSLELPDSLEFLSGFANCTGLTEVHIPENVETIYSLAFSGCSNLRSVTIPDSVTVIYGWAFSSCKLKSIIIPASVTRLYGSAFSNCTELQEVWFRGDAPQIDTDAFKNVVANAYYPVNKDTWTESKMQNYGGTITWASYQIQCDEHSYETVVTAPTCTEQGYTTYKCTNCGESYVGDYVDALGHNHVGTVTEPTCKAQGYTTYTCTNCGDSYVDNYTDPVDHVYVDGYCKWCGQGEQYVKWYSGTTSLNGTIDLNIYVLLSKDLVNASDAFVRFTYDGNVVDVPMADALFSPTGTAPNRYRFSVPVYAKQLADKVNVVFMKGSQQIGKDLNYSVVQYCENQIKKVTDPLELALYKAMLNYGAAAQLLLDHNVDTLANASLSEADKILPTVDASAYKYAISGSEVGIKAKSATLMLDDVVKVRVYFTLTGDKAIEDYTFTIDGQVVTPQYNDKGWYVETDGIAATDLEHMFNIQVGGITVKYGALSYVNSKIVSSTAAETEKNIAKALYAYWQAAENYLG